MDYSSVGTYLRSLPKHKTLEKAEEYQLAEIIQEKKEGAEEAKKTLVTHNLRLVVSIAKKHQGLGVCMEDLIAVGNLGLLKAVERFDPKHKCKLSTYATYWIKEHIQEAIKRQGRTIRIPEKSLRKVVRIYRIIESLQVDLGREPDIEEIAGEIMLPTEKIEEILSWCLPCLTLETIIGEQKFESFTEDKTTKNPLENALNSSDKNWTTTLLNSLTTQEHQIITERFGIHGKEKTLNEIGEKMGLTRERIRQIEAKALVKLRKRAIALGLQSTD